MAPVRRLTILAGATLVAGCQVDSRPAGEWAGQMRDSAGIVVVTNAPTGMWTDETRWGLEEDLRIGTAAGDRAHQFEQVGGVAVDATGAIHVLDGREIRVFDGEGAHLRSMGRAGEGPGELARPSAILIGAGDTIFVPDSRNGRVQLYGPRGDPSGSLPITGPGIPLAWGMMPDGTLVQELRTDRILILTRKDRENAADTLASTPVGEAMVIREGIPQMTLFGAEPMWVVTTDGRLVTGRTSHLRFEVRTASGRLERVVHTPSQRRPFTDAEQGDFRARLADVYADSPPSPATDRMLRSLEYADHYPTFATLFAGPDESIWVQRAKRVSEMTPLDLEQLDVRAVAAPVFDVFDREGRYLGPLAVPDSFEPLLTVGHHLYGTVRDELGVQYVVRLRVVEGAG